MKNVKKKFTFLTALTWIAQVGISIAVPLAFFIGGAVWIRNRFPVGDWIVIAGVVLGLLSAAGGLVSSLRSLNRLGKEEEDPPKGFNSLE